MPFIDCEQKSPYANIIPTHNLTSKLILTQASYASYAIILVILLSFSNLANCD